MNSIISVHGLSKVYRIGSRLSGHDRYRTLRESLTDVAVATWRKLERRPRSLADGFGGGRMSAAHPAPPDEFWALDDVTFEVQPGEVVGIIGRNGAGKSTLLKILSQITEPTRGRVEMRGRVGSLLEVGTGFHPELTGRENIYLNGAILGMSRREIARKFDEIVAFAEIEKFLDMPVKRYSSGMYVRLAFAVASHLEPEILVIDEVLAVGDSMFQKKCLSKMDQVSRERPHGAVRQPHHDRRQVPLLPGVADREGPGGLRRDRRRGGQRLSELGGQEVRGSGSFPRTPIGRRRGGRGAVPIRQGHRPRGQGGGAALLRAAVPRQLHLRHASRTSRTGISRSASARSTGPT